MYDMLQTSLHVLSGRLKEKYALPTGLQDIFFSPVQGRGGAEPPQISDMNRAVWYMHRNVVLQMC